MFEALIIARKELTQVSNRGRFHAEKGFFAAVAAAGLMVFCLRETGPSPAAWEETAEFARSLFLFVSASACFALALSALFSSSGLILSEVTGGRFDLLLITAVPLKAVVVGKGLAVLVRYLSLALLLLPLALVPIVFAAAYFLFNRSATNLQFVDAVAAEAMFIELAAALIILLQSCATISRERASRTLEALLVTPAGGPGMLSWKGAGVFAVQAPGLLIAFGVLVGAGLVNGFRPAVIVWEGLYFAALLFFLFALGASFSLETKTPAKSVGLAGLVVFGSFLARMVTYGGESSLGASDVRGSFHTAVVLGAVGVPVLLALRNLVPRARLHILCAGLGWLMAFLPSVTVLAYGGRVKGFTGLMAPFRLPYFRDVRPGYIGACAGALAAVGLALYVGALPGFDRAVRSEGV